MEMIQNILLKLILLFDNFVHNKGLSIILVTIVLKIILFPLSIKQLKASSKIKELQPELEKIKKLYANDKTAMNTKTMEMYKEKKINPMSGCLPMLVQIPIFFAFFALLRNATLFPNNADGQFLFWFVGGLDNTYILPVINSILIYFTNKSMLGDQQGSANQKYMNIFLPIMLFFFSLKFPVGIHLYMIVSSLVSLLQTLLLPKIMK